MIITINGKPEEIKLQSNLAELISSKGLCANNLVIEHNAIIVPKQKWPKTALKENDVVEIVSFVGGG
ncbi:MAG: thiamine biosynthesis protein ThiS [Candidatus Omnitrophica bacterium CG11_big_fil_rev_8_21_14_0_20_43_6]|nr:MAG: thiamine biosynthesis protein ThiS [Candidatus Omnitrophica bacterium CG11_big_fil_rev_8_21_14_0_20_43_6]